MADHHSDNAHSDNALSANAARIATEETAALRRPVRPARKALHERASKHLPLRRGVDLPGQRPVPDLPRARAGLARLGRRRHRVPRLPRRVRRQRRRPRAPEDRRGDRAGGTHRHALRHHRRPPPSRWPRSSAGASSSTRCASRTPAPRPPWTRSASPAPPPGATQVLKIEGSYHGHHDTVMFSVRAQRRRHGRARPARVDADVEGHPGGARRLHARRAVQRRRRARAAC